MHTTTEPARCSKCGQAFKSLKWLHRHETVWGHKPEREFLVVQTTRWYVTATDKTDAIAQVSDGLGGLAGTDYRAREEG